MSKNQPGKQLALLILLICVILPQAISSKQASLNQAQNFKTSNISNVLQANHRPKEWQNYEGTRPRCTRAAPTSSLFGLSSREHSTSNVNQPLGVANQGQCPAFNQANARLQNQHDRVQVDPTTGRRSFSAKIVGIFSCLDQQAQHQQPSNDLTLDFRLAKPVIDLAVRAVNVKYANSMHFNVTYRTAADICKHQQAAGHAADEYYVNGANYFVGPGCSESLASVGQLASYWNVPICSTGYLPEMVTARFSPLTLMQLSLSVQSVGEMLLELFQMYKWRHLVIVTDEKHPLHSLIRDGLLEFFHTMYKTGASSAPSTQTTSSTSSGLSLPTSGFATLPQQRFNGAGGANGGVQQQQQQQRQQLPYYINITSRNFAHSKERPPDYEQVMLEAASMSRIMLLLARSSTIGKLLEAAHAQDMSRGQFVFIAHELFETQAFEAGAGSSAAAAAGAINLPNVREQDLSSGNQQNLVTMSNNQRVEQHQRFAVDEKIEIVQSEGALNEQAMREIFQPLMTISLRIPTTPEFDTFRSEVVGLSEREFNYRLQPASLKSLYSLGLAAFIYDCVMLYADKVHFILNQTQFSRIDGKTIFELAAGRTFMGGLTGDLTINRAGQRVIDFTLNDFSPKTLALEPIAHFYAIERRLAFLPGRAPHWTLRNQSTPRSDPRCRINDTVVCRWAGDDELDSQSAYHAAHANGSSDRVVLGVWLVVVIVLSVALTSSIIGFLVYRRFRIESELLNLWWSIKYEDIIFEDENEIICDGKRSMSSLAISNESFPVASGGGVPPPGGTAAGSTTGAPSGRTSPAGASVSLAALGDDQAADRKLQEGPPGAAGRCMQLSVSGALDGGGGSGALSAAHSSSSLSVGGGGNLLASSGLQPTAIVGSSPAGSTNVLSLQQAASTSGGCGDSQATAARGHHHHHNLSGHHHSSSNQQRRFVMSTSTGGASKLIPLLNKSTGSATGSSSGLPTTTTGATSGAKSIGATSHCAAGNSSTKSTKATGTNVTSAGAPSASLGASASAKDPSISSQNKNVKLRLGTVLNGRDQSHTTKVGLYKASRVAAKHLNVRNLTINRQLLIELRQVRDLTHENLIKFIGLCPEEPNVAIVSELCTRGNLQDLLQNETIRLDWPFRFSIINDIVDGLIHLHSSPVQYHGRLKSSNCVIDNRFVVKLTDFGLPTLLAAVEMDEGTNGAGPEVNPRLLLWTAPEHLRTKFPLLSGSQKGDIYSLAIIFQEIITRCGPFECEPILCGSSEVGVPADLLAQQQHQQQLQQLSMQQPPLIRTSEHHGTNNRLNVRGGGATSGQNRRGGVAGARSSQLNLNQLQLQQQQQLQLQQQMQLLQPIVVQHKQRLEPEEIVNLVRMGLSPPFRPYFRPDVVGGAGVVGQQHGAGLVAANNLNSNLTPANNQQQQQQQQLQSGNGQAPDFSVADLVAIVQSCWQEAPAMRPTIASVKQQIKKLRRGCHLDGANLMDNLLQRMERYTDNLESLVEQKTAELMEEKKRSEELLYEMLPRFVVDQLKYGHSVTPEAYDAVTISFSDIKDFTSIAAQSSPIEVVNLLNQLYTEFDDCIARYDVYKVETIGDAYMVVSGLPIRNGDLHAKEIAEMSLALLELIRNFEVAHLPHVNLELRIGIHSGPCASGVVGTRMFRYCLFGDTVNTASRMESHGEPMKIHISEDSADILRRFRTFNIEPRGQVDIKGKGPMNTYWLTGKTSENNILSYLGSSLGGIGGR